MITILTKNSLFKGYLNEGDRDKIHTFAEKVIGRGMSPPPPIIFEAVGQKLKKKNVTIQDYRIFFVFNFSNCFQNCWEEGAPTLHPFILQKCSSINLLSESGKISYLVHGPI